MTEASRSARSLDVAALFLRLGLTAFGGPAAHVAMMENEVVVRRRWLTPERFLDMFGAVNLIPGPSSSELAVFIGYEVAGVTGLVLAGVCFVLPAALVTAAIAWLYVRFGSLPRTAGVLYGIKPVVIAIILKAIWELAPRATKKSRWLVALTALATVASYLGVDTLAVLAGTGLLAWLGRSTKPTGDEAGPRWLLPVAIAGGSTTAAPLRLGLVFLTFLKLGAVVFGSGYVLIAFLRDELVTQRHWLTEAQLVDAVAVGQVTPGPVFTTATFIGYLLAGGPGAVLATIGIFLPGFVMVALLRPLVARLRRSPSASAFLDGVNVASLALMAVAVLSLGRATLVDALALGIFVLSGIALIRFRLNSTWLIAAGAVVGLLR